MAYTNFKPEFWAEKIERENSKLCVLKNLANNQYEGTLKYGTKVTIAGIGAVTIGDYTGASIESETLNDTSVAIEVNKRKYFAVEVDDVDKVQSIPGLRTAIATQAAENLADVEDADIGAVMLAAVSATLLPVASLTPANARTTIHALKTNLIKEGVKKTMKICAAVTPDFYEKLAIRNEEINTDNTKDLENGYDAKVAGVEIYVSNNLPKKDSKDVIFVYTKKRAVGHVSQLTEIEATRPSDKFCDLLKGLNIYGTGVIRPKELVGAVITAYGD